MRGSEKCLLCGNSASSSNKNEEYLNGFCDTCIMSMKKEKEKRVAKCQSPYDEIVKQINVQIENIETVVISILDKTAPSSNLSSSSTKGSESTSKSQLKKYSIPSTLGSDSSAYGSDMTKKRADDKNSIEPSVTSVPYGASNRPKKSNRSKYTPTVKPVDD